MKFIKTAFKFASLVMHLMVTEKGRACVDGFLDIVEETFIHDDKAMELCQRIREVLMLPDDD